MFTVNVKVAEKAIEVSNETTNQKFTFVFAGKGPNKKVVLDGKGLDRSTNSKANVIKNHLNHMFNEQDKSKRDHTTRMLRFEKRLGKTFENLSAINRALLESQK